MVWLPAYKWGGVSYNVPLSLKKAPHFNTDVGALFIKSGGGPCGKCLNHFLGFAQHRGIGRKVEKTQ